MAMNSRWKDVFRGLKEKFLGKEHEKYAAAPSPAEQARATAARQVEATPRRILKRDPYFVQIGFDFGTSYSKCVCRDVMTNKAWIYLPAGSDGFEEPFLIPCSLQLREGKLRHLDNTKADYRANGLYHLKHALEKVAQHHWKDPALRPYWDSLGEVSEDRLGSFVQACAVYLLAGILGEVRDDVRRRLPGFGTYASDYVAVNLAVPVADAERPQVNEMYHRILNEAWALADQLKGHPALEIEEIEKLVSWINDEQSCTQSDDCFVYPETSANVQGFVRSRSSSPGIYLFSDTGAGTVDQSVFIFSKSKGIDHLDYLHGSVIPLGSSLIERRAAEDTGTADWKALEMWRERKESGGTEAPLKSAKSWIREHLSIATHGVSPRQNTN